MNLVTRIKPYKLQGTKVEEVKRKVENLYRGISWGYGSYGNCLQPFGIGSFSDSNFVLGYNIVKKNAKKIRDKKTGKYKVIEPALVEAFVYKIPTQFLRDNKLKVNQTARYFELIKK